MQLIILGLRRSGTTAFWRTWRQDERFVCYNEPFCRILERVNDPGWRDVGYTGMEMLNLWKRNPRAFWDHFVAIERREEMRRGMSDQQREYLAWLFASAEHVCTDITRCHFKIADLKAIAPEAVFVHLRRPPQNWVTSIALPSTTNMNRIRNPRLRAWRKFMRNAHNTLSKRRFWETRSGFGFHGYEEMMGVGVDSLFGFRLRDSGLDPEAVLAMPLAARLLAMWKLFTDEVEREGPRLFGDRFLSVNFNQFCASPVSAIAAVYDKLGLEAPPLNFSSIHSPPPAFDPSSPNWEKYFDLLQIDKRWLRDPAV